MNTKRRASAPGAVLAGGCASQLARAELASNQ